jgi:hypothetical protein
VRDTFATKIFCCTILMRLLPAGCHPPLVIAV